MVSAADILVEALVAGAASAAAVILAVGAEETLAAAGVQEIGSLSACQPAGLCAKTE